VDATNGKMDKTGEGNRSFCACRLAGCTDGTGFQMTGQTWAKSLSGFLTG